MATWWVNQPDTTVFLKDKPLFYNTTRGEIGFKLHHKGNPGPNGIIDSSQYGIFGVGTNWHSPWRSYVIPMAMTGTNDSAIVYFGDGSARLYFVGAEDYVASTYFILTNSEYILTYANGSRSVYSNWVTLNGTSFCFLTRDEDPQGNATQFSYSFTTSGGVTNSIRLNQITDADNNSISFVYTNTAYYSNLIAEVQGPYGLTNRMHYSASGQLTNITDVIGLSSGMSYDSSNRLATLTTAYGTTTFSYFGTNSWKALLVDEMGLRKHFYLDGFDSTNIWPTAEAESRSLASYLTNHTIVETIETNGFDKVNTFYWTPLQFQNLQSSIRTAIANQPPTFDPANLSTNDFQVGWTTHWLKSFTTNGLVVPGIVKSLERAPGQLADGAEQGVVTWYDYEGKDLSLHGRNFEGKRRLPGVKAMRASNGDWRVETWGRTARTAYPTAMSNNWTRIGLDPIDLIDTYATAWHSETITYDDFPNHGSLRTRTSGSVIVSSNTYNADKQILTNLNALGEMTRYEYTNKRVSKIVYPSKRVTDFFYDAAGFLEKVVEGDDTTSFATNSFTYTNGLVWTHTDERHRSLTNSYDKLGRLLTMSDSDGTVAYTYDRLDLVQRIYRMGFVEKYVYNPFRQLLYHTNANTNVTIYGYCDCGSLESVADPMSNTNSFTYDPLGRRIVTQFPGGSWSSNTYALSGELIRTVDNAGVAITNWYTINGLLYSATNAFGRVFLNAFDEENRIIRQVDQNGVQHGMSYDLLDRLLVRTNEAFHDLFTDFFYAYQDRFDYTNNQAGPIATYREYITALVTSGELTSVDRITISPRVVNEYDAFGRRTNEVHFSTNNVAVMTNAFAYNGAGDLVQLRDGKAQTTTWKYDRFGRTTNKLDAVGAEMFRYGYDANGRLTTRWTPEKLTTAYSYDPVGNLTAVNYQTTSDLSFSYDRANRLTTMADALGTTTYSYTAFSAVQSEDGPWADDAVTYSYSANRLRSGLSLAQPNGPGWSASYGYDAVNRLTSVASPAGAFAYQYHPGLLIDADFPAPSPSSLVKQLTLPGGSIITNAFDQQARWLGTYLRHGSGTNLNHHVYGYNGLDQRIKQTRAGRQLAGVLWTNSVDYGYDALGQLVDATGKELEGSTIRSHEVLGYAYDAAGNLSFRTNNGLVQAFTVNSLNQLSNSTRSGTLTVAGVTHGPATSVTVATNGGSVTAERYSDNSFAGAGLPAINGNNTYTAVGTDASGRSATNALTVYLPTTASFQYDQNGNLVFDGLRRMAYDDENQLIRVTVTNEWKSEFVYDGKMRRRIRREYTWRNSAWVMTAEVRYIYDGNLVIQERDQFNVPQVTYTRGKDLSGSLEGAGGIGGLLARTDHALPSGSGSQAHAYYHADGNGNVTCLVDTNQTVVARYSYDPFGNTLAAAGPMAEVNLYRFSSKELHEASGLVYYLYRFYDPNLQRWPNRDPIQEIGGFNLYRFAINTPVINTDPFGLRITWFGGFRDDDVPPNERDCYNRCTQHLDVAPFLAGIMAGAAGGVAAGAVVGSVAPGAGTVVGGFFGAVGGAVGGWMGSVATAGVIDEYCKAFCHITCPKKSAP